MIVSEIGEDSLDLFFHLESAVIRAERDLLSIRGRAPPHSFDLNAALTRDVLGKRSQLRVFIDSQNIALDRRANLQLGDDLLAPLINCAHCPSILVRAVGDNQHNKRTSGRLRPLDGLIASTLAAMHRDRRARASLYFSATPVISSTCMRNRITDDCPS